jgi:riboflavin biosynthesis pyrimidine reductase
MIHRQFLTAGLADEIHLVIAPFFVGDPAAPRDLSCRSAASITVLGVRLSRRWEWQACRDGRRRWSGLRSGSRET